MITFTSIIYLYYYNYFTYIYMYDYYKYIDLIIIYKYTYFIYNYCKSSIIYRFIYLFSKIIFHCYLNIYIKINKSCIYI